MEDTVNERNKYYPEAQISVLSNATRISNPDVVKALMMIDNRILKLDSAIEATAKAIDRPVGSYSVAKIVELMKKFDGNFTMQTMFLEGDVAGNHINNMTDEEVSAWLDVVKATKPKQVMIYTIDRATPEQNLRKATHDELDAIRDRVKAAGFEVSVSY